MSKKLIGFANCTQNTFLKTSEIEIIISNFDQKVFVPKVKVNRKMAFQSIRDKI
jgi:hypothetical protein